MSSGFTFQSLTSSIHTLHRELEAQAHRAVNISLTLRNWMIGCHISEFELHGADRAAYGSKLLEELANTLQSQGTANCSKRQLYLYLTFYRTYPQLEQTLSDPLRQRLPGNRRPPEKVRTVSAQFATSPEKLLNHLSFSHFSHLVALEDDLKRSFYEVECLRGSWSVRELKRQIATLYFERSGLSEEKERLGHLVQGQAEAAGSVLDIRDPYIFEFLGLKPQEVLHEPGLEDALLGKLQDFLLELGHGFCFEARQKRILIGDKHYFVDLVFYHRILKCHVLIELKADEFSHEYIGQLNTYVSWFRQNMMTSGDNPPVGLLLCTRKDTPLVEYALAGMDNQLFVSKYQVELPRREEIERFLEQQLQEHP